MVKLAHLVLLAKLLSQASHDSLIQLAGSHSLLDLLAVFTIITRLVVRSLSVCYVSESCAMFAFCLLR